MKVWKDVRKRVSCLLMVLLLFGGICVPQVPVEAASVQVIYGGRTKTYSKMKTMIQVNGKKIGLTKQPIFLKDGSYMGPAATIFKNSSLKVGYQGSSDHKTLVLTYNNHVLKMTSGKTTALLDGKKTSFGTAPIYAKYKSSNLKRWIVPLKSVCSRLGIDYSLGSDGLIRISGSANGTSSAMGTTATTEGAVPGSSSSSSSSSTSGSSGSSEKIVLVLDAGHGGSDSGALSSDRSKAEKNMNLAIILAAKKKFDSDARFKVYYTRTSDTYPSLSARADLANKMNADMFVSVHINSAGATATGTETLYNPDRLTATKKNNLTSLQLATTMQKYAVAATGFRDRGLKQRCVRLKNNLRVLENTKMPACLIEYGFISNPTECKIMSANTTRYGQALYNGIVNLMRTKKRI